MLQCEEAILIIFGKIIVFGKLIKTYVGEGLIHIYCVSSKQESLVKNRYLGPR